MENLGTTADVTGGNVECVDPQEMGLKVASLLKNKTLAMAIEATLTLPAGFHPRAGDGKETAADDTQTGGAATEMGAGGTIPLGFFTLQAPGSSSRLH